MLNMSQRTQKVWNIIFLWTLFLRAMLIPNLRSKPKWKSKVPSLQKRYKRNIQMLSLGGSRISRQRNRRQNYRVQHSFRWQSPPTEEDIGVSLRIKKTRAVHFQYEVFLFLFAQRVLYQTYFPDSFLCHSAYRYSSGKFPGDRRIYRWHFRLLDINLLHSYHRGCAVL